MDPFPLMPPRATSLRLDHFDEYQYKGDTTTLLYKYVDALCGVTGAGALVNEIFLARMGSALETIYFNDLDYIMGSVSFLSRSPSESYTADPMTDMLTAEEWDELRVKDAWYRARIKSFFAACSKGGTPDGIRQCVDAALGVDAEIFETWRWIDNFGLVMEDLGRSPVPNRSEVVIRPHKQTVTAMEMRLLREMLNRMTPLDTIVTVDPSGLAVSTPLTIQAAAADSQYFEVQKEVTPTPIIANLPPPELLAIDLLPTEKWLFKGKKTLAPYAAFNISQEYGYFYLVGGGQRSPIDSVMYGTLHEEPSKITVFEVSDQRFPGITLSVPDVKVADQRFPGLSISVPDVVGNIYLRWPKNNWINYSLSEDLYNWVNISYPITQFPLRSSIEYCYLSLKQLIINTPGKFILVGHSLGASVISQIYKEIRSGDLSHRRSDLLGGITFGNPDREEGHTFPGGPDPGGFGCDRSEYRLVDTEDLWWDFAAPGDPLTTATFERGELSWQKVAFDSIVYVYTGNLDNLERFINDSGWPGNYGQAIHDALFGWTIVFNRRLTTPHTSYDTYAPLNDGRSCFRIALDYIRQLGTANPPPPTQVVMREPNYEIFNSTGTYSDWIPYEKADCPENFPGGKWGIHPSRVPALYPNGTPYQFPWASQSAFVEYMKAKIREMGGLADDDHYRVPIQKECQAKVVFWPDYAVAYSSPARESTVTKSVTHRKKRMPNNEIRNPSIFVR